MMFCKHVFFLAANRAIVTVLRHNKFPTDDEVEYEMRRHLGRDEVAYFHARLQKYWSQTVRGMRFAWKDCLRQVIISTMFC